MGMTQETISPIYAIKMLPTFFDALAETDDFLLFRDLSLDLSSFDFVLVFLLNNSHKTSVSKYCHSLEQSKYKMLQINM